VPTRLLGAAVALALLAGLAACSGTSNNASAGAALPNGTGAPLSTLSSADAPVRTSLTAVPKAEGPVNIYAQPGDTTPKSTQDNPWLYDNQPGAEVPLVFMVKQESGDSYEVFLATRPNGSTGFVKKADMDVEQNPYRIEVDSAAFRLKAYKGNEVILDAPIAVGMADAPTPGGEFYLNVLLTPPDPGGDYGPFAYGLSGHSEVLDTFNGGDGQLGIHGTNHPELLGTSVSHGCIRLRNEDITKLAEEVKLPLGTPVKILS
jgi:lipoprotein-anchoring transpeptidase ErfK/SrfK